ncbi:MAG: carbohydrate ABC transporter permease [Anaerolineae bacterium]
MPLHVYRATRRILGYLALLVIVLLSLFPLFWIFLTSIKPRSLTFAIPPAWIFPPTLENYREVFLYGPFPKYFVNSLIVALGTTAIALLAGSLAAYAFARFEFRGSHVIQMAVLIPQIIPPITIIIPLFVLFRSINMIDRIPSLIFAYLSFTIPLSIWMMVGFFRDVPRELEEAALIDGASRWQAMWKVVFPLVTPGLAATAILCFIFSWNEFLYAVILTGRNAKTVPVAITGFITNRDILWGRIAASGSVVLLPVLIFALSVQRYLVRGLSRGAIKG